MSKDTLFTNDSGAAGGAIDYVKDVFDDASLPANVNTGFSTSIAKNPLTYAYGNDDAPRYGAKTLYVKDMVLVEDRSKWVNSRPTYEIIWHEPFPAAKGYCFGYAQIGKADAPYVAINNNSSGFGVGGVIRRVAFILNPVTTSTVDSFVDGVAATTFTLGSSPTNQILARATKYITKVHATSNETKDIHDFRVVPGAPASGPDVEQQIVGVVVYFENVGANIDCFPGTTYVNKSKITSSSISTLALPSFGTSLGGRSVIYKTQTSGYTLTSNSTPTIQSVATGTSGTNTLNLTTGTGASFAAGYGIVAQYGTTLYLGSIVSMSTDTATVTPTLTFGISGSIYRAWTAGTSVAINASLMTLGFSYNTNQNGFSNFFLDSLGRYNIWGINIGTSVLTTGVTANITYLNPKSIVPLTGGTGVLHIEGYFSALELETYGTTGSFAATFGINGIPGCISINVGMTGYVKKTVLTDLGPGWNRVQVGIGSSTANFGIQGVNFYQNARNLGISYGLLSEFDTLQSYVPQTAINATTIALGTHRRFYADQLGYRPGTWTRALSTTAAGGVQYSVSATNATLVFEYFGKNIAVMGALGASTPGCSFVASIDGVALGVSAGSFLNVMNTVATEGFHTLAIANRQGTLIIHAIDVTRTQDEFKSLQKVSLPPPKIQSADSGPSEVWVTGSGGPGSGNTRIWCFTTAQSIMGSAITYVADGVNGDYFIINEDGLYGFDAEVGGASGTTQAVGWTLNEVGQGTTALYSMTRSFIVSGKLDRATAAGGTSSETSAMKVLFKGDILRVHTQDNVSDDAFMPYARVVQIRSFAKK